MLLCVQFDKWLGYMILDSQASTTFWFSVILSRLVVLIWQKITCLLPIQKNVFTFPFLSTADTRRTFWGELDLPLDWDLELFSIGLPSPAADKLIWEWCWVGRLNFGLDRLFDINDPANEVWQLEQALVQWHDELGVGEAWFCPPPPGWWPPCCLWWSRSRWWPACWWEEQHESLLW